MYHLCKRYGNINLGFKYQYLNTNICGVEQLQDSIDNLPRLTAFSKHGYSLCSSSKGDADELLRSC